MTRHNYSELASKNYLDRVDDAAHRRDGQPFFNESLGHTAVIVERVIADAYRSVSILSRNLEPRIYGRNRTLDSTMRFLDEDPRGMRILLEDADRKAHAENPFLNKFKDHPKVALRHVPENLQKKYEFHFLVADGESYRFEPDKSKSAAIVAFGDAEGANNLESIFNRIWEQSIPLISTRGCFDLDSDQS